MSTIPRLQSSWTKSLERNIVGGILAGATLYGDKSPKLNSLGRISFNAIFEAAILVEARPSKGAILGTIPKAQSSLA